MQMLGVRDSVGVDGNQWLSGDTKFGSLTRMMMPMVVLELPSLAGRSPFRPSRSVGAFVRVTGRVEYKAA